MIALLATALLAQPAEWPSCNEVDAFVASDCTLVTTDALGWLVTFDFAPNDEPEDLEIVVWGADAIPFQTIDLPVGRFMNARAPELLDLDGDGFDDIVIMIGSANVQNGEWSFLFGEFDGFVMPTDPVSGFELKPVEGDLFYIRGRIATGLHDGLFFSREGLTLDEHALVTLNARQSEGWTCRLDRAVDDRGEEFYCNVALSE